MNDEKLLEDFFRALKVVLTNASAYSKDHPYFIKSVENFKIKLEDILAVLNPLRIGITDAGIMVEDKHLTKSGFYDELARLLHQRKIKSLEFRNGVILSELVKLLSVISLPLRDILKGGGINVLLGESQFGHFTLEELDYSELLHGHGQECSDIWSYMLKEAADSKDAAKLEALANDFGPLMKRSGKKDIFETEDVPASIGDFLVSLKEKNKEKFDKCSKDVFLWLLQNKNSLQENELEKLKPVFKSLDQDDFSNLLWEGIAQEDNFDDLSLQLFSKISEQKNPPQSGEKSLPKADGLGRLQNNTRAVKRVQDLLAGSQGDKLSPVYRKILESLIKEVSSSGVLSFDQKALRVNYRYIVLNLLFLDDDRDNLNLAAEVLGEELAGIFADNDIGFLRELYDRWVKKEGEGLETGIELRKKLSVFIENLTLNQCLAIEQEFLLEMVSSPTQEASYYLDKIFVAEKPDRGVLNLFFRLFPEQRDAFYQRLEKKLQDLDFLSGLINSLGALQADKASAVLEFIYTAANELIKCEALKAMLRFKKVDAGFLLRQLDTGSFLLRKSLLSVLMLETQSKEEALNLLLKIPSPWGSKNRLLMENIQIVADLKIIDSAGRIRDLSGKRFFWNRELRYKAKQVLGEWHAL